MRSIRTALVAFTLLTAGAMPAAAELTLHRGNMAEPETLDPHRATGLPEAQIFYDLYEGLAVRGPDGTARPGLAERWDVSEDGLTYTFHLRDNAVWSDGTAVTAEDVVYSLRRVVDPVATQAPNGLYIWNIRNAKAITEGKAAVDSLGVEAVDPRTVRITLDRPTPYLIKVLSYPMLTVLPKAKLEAAGDDFFQPGNLVSAGAYKLAEYVPQGHVKLVRNARHRNADKAQIDSVYFYATENQDTELKRYRAGELHTTYRLPPAQIDWVRKNLPEHLRTTPQNGTYYFAPNMTKEPWASKSHLLVPALSMALDREIITEKLAQGGEPPSLAYIPPVPDYERQVPEWASWPLEKRVAEAKRLLAEAGYPDGKGLTVDILYNTADLHRRITVGLAGMWQQRLGVKTQMTNQEWKVFLNTRRTKDFEGLSRQGYIGAYDDADIFLKWFRSDLGSENPAGYADPAYDALLDAASNEVEPQKRRDLLQQAEAKLLADGAVLPIMTYTSSRLVNPKVKGWVDNPLDVHPTQYLSIAQ